MPSKRLTPAQQQVLDKACADTTGDGAAFNGRKWATVQCLRDLGLVTFMHGSKDDGTTWIRVFPTDEGRAFGEVPPMDKLTLEALKGSIRKWERIRDGEIGNESASNCPLCHRFADGFRPNAQDCERPLLGPCPVKAATGRPACADTL